ncbi:MAG: GNAT family N-acetyltransferase, partial [Lachnospiraceae bacterium]|nr:GNAT family N-acetyltransferase [Lachnospiraceae bacterium]
MNIRKASMADLEAVASMELLCFPKAEAATIESFEQRIAVFGDSFWLLEDENGRLIGMINGMVTDEP